jgi:hypothetical protein
MNFVKLGDNIYLNLDAVASITWSGEGPNLCATVKYLVASSSDPNGQQAGTQVLMAEAALALRQYLDGGQALRGTSPKQIEPNSPAPFSKGQELAESHESVDTFSFNDGQKKSWYFVTDANGQRYFLAMVNAKGSCSMRSFDAESGRFLKKVYGAGDFQQHFGAYLKNAKEVSVSRQPNLERDCRQKLPPDLLEYLKRQISQ